jgi:hypothetical protein
MTVSAVKDLEEPGEECAYWYYGQGQLLSGFEGVPEGLGGSFSLYTLWNSIPLVYILAHLILMKL